MLTVYAIQMDIVWENKPANFARVTELVDGAGIAPGGLIVLPEMFATGFSMSADAIAEDAETGETALFLGDLALRSGCHVLAGVVTVSPAGVRPCNEALVFGPDGTMAGRYAKQKPFTPSGERDSYVAGDRPVVVVINGVRVAPLICYDLRFPELFREALTLGVDAFVVIASWSSARVAHWSALLRARAIENQAYMIAVNRVGADPTPLTYPGASVIIDPSGAVLTEAASGGETVVTADLNADFVAAYRADLPFLADR